MYSYAVGDAMQSREEKRARDDGSGEGAVVEVHEDEREDGWDYGFCYVGWFCGVWNDVRAWWFGF